MSPPILIVLAQNGSTLDLIKKQLTECEVLHNYAKPYRNTFISNKMEEITLSYFSVRKRRDFVLQSNSQVG